MKSKLNITGFCFVLNREVGKMAMVNRHTALIEDMILVASTYISQLTLPSNSSFGEFLSLFWPVKTLVLTYYFPICIIKK